MKPLCDRTILCGFWCVLYNINTYGENLTNLKLIKLLPAVFITGHSIAVIRVLDTLLCALKAFLFVCLFVCLFYRFNIAVFN